MSLAERFNYFNKINFNNFLNFKIDNFLIGYIHKYFAKNLTTYFKDNFVVDKKNFLLDKIYNSKFTFTKSPDSFNILTDFFRDITKFFLKKEVIKKITYEDFPVFSLNSNKLIFKIERSVLSILGIQSRGVHLNGYVLKNNSIYIWIAKRSNTKLTFPSKLDNIVAGGISYGYNYLDTLIKESWEEATIDKELIKQATLCNKLYYLYPNRKGIRNDIMYIYNLKLPLDFVPTKNDGEVDKFFLMPYEEVLNILKNTNNFKFNSAISVILFLIEKNLINKENTHQRTINIIKNKIYSMKL